MRSGIEAALRGLHGQLVGGSAGVVSEGTIQTWLAVHLAGVFEPARVAAEVAFRAAHPERPEPNRPEQERVDATANSSGDRRVVGHR